MKTNGKRIATKASLFSPSHSNLPMEHLYKEGELWAMRSQHPNMKEGGLSILTQTFKKIPTLYFLFEMINLYFHKQFFFYDFEFYSFFMHLALFSWVSSLALYILSADQTVN